MCWHCWHLFLFMAKDCCDKSFFKAFCCCFSRLQIKLLFMECYTIQLECMWHEFILNRLWISYVIYSLKIHAKVWKNMDQSEKQFIFLCSVRFFVHSHEFYLNTFYKFNRYILLDRSHLCKLRVSLRPPSLTLASKYEQIHVLLEKLLNF